MRWRLQPSCHRRKQPVFAAWPAADLPEALPPGNASSPPVMTGMARRLRAARSDESPGDAATPPSARGVGLAKRAAGVEKRFDGRRRTGAHRGVVSGVPDGRGLMASRGLHDSKRPSGLSSLGLFFLHTLGGWASARAAASRASSRASRRPFQMWKPRTAMPSPTKPKIQGRTSPLCLLISSRLPWIL